MWTFYRPNITEPQTVFGPSSDGKGVMYPSFKERFRVIKSEGGFQNLVIRNATFSDGGMYMCIDEEGFAFGPWSNEGQSNWATANLVVTGEYINLNHFDLYYFESQMFNITWTNIILFGFIFPDKELFSKFHTLFNLLMCSNNFYYKERCH